VRIVPDFRLAAWFRAAAVAEACSWAGLLIGMFFKYVVVHDEIGVKVFGPIHGVLFLLYVGMTIAAGRSFGWRLRTTLLGLTAGIPPFATIWFERRVHRRELLVQPSPASAT
jgi:integral membrane protein